MPPKYIIREYHPTPREWRRWIRFRDRAIALAAMGYDAMEAFFDACAKDRRLSTCTGTFASSHSTSDRLTLEIFPWATFTRYHNPYAGTWLTVDMETHDFDTRHIAEAYCG
jgi:hypothetical protein